MNHFKQAGRRAIDYLWTLRNKPAPSDYIKLVIARMQADDASDLSCYRCSECHEWHVGHSRWNNSTAGLVVTLESLL